MSILAQLNVLVSDIPLQKRKIMVNADKISSSIDWKTTYRNTAIRKTPDIPSHHKLI